MSPRLAMTAALGVSVTLAACSDDPDRIELPLVLSTFEEGCGALPCAWEPLPGSEGAVARVRTVHDGVHGLRLVGDGVGAIGPARVDGLAAAGGFGRGPEIVYVPPPWEAPLGALVTGRCDAGAALDVAVAADVGVEALEAPTSQSVVYSGVVMPTGAFSAPQGGLLVPDGGDDPPPDRAVVLGASTVAIVKSGPGTCDVARLLVGPPQS